jgi:hypothetical protein
MVERHREGQSWLRILVLVYAILFLVGCSENPSNTEQTYTSTDNTLTFIYSSDWTVRESDGQIFLGTSAELAEAAANGSIVTESGQFVASIFLFPATEVSRLDEDAGLHELLTIVFASLSSEGSPGPITNVPIGSHTAARMEGHIGQSDVLLLTLEIETDVFAVFVGSSALDEMDGFETALVSTAASLNYAPQ